MAGKDSQHVTRQVHYQGSETADIQQTVWQWCRCCQTWCSFLARCSSWSTCLAMGKMACSGVHCWEVCAAPRSCGSRRAGCLKTWNWWVATCQEVQVRLMSVKCNLNCKASSFWPDHLRCWASKAWGKRSVTVSFVSWDWNWNWIEIEIDFNSDF